MPRKRVSFYMVYGEGQSAPTVKHATEYIAEQEARRLAVGHPGIEFFVLKAVGVAFKQAAFYEPLTDDGKSDDLPF